MRKFAEHWLRGRNPHIWLEAQSFMHAAALAFFTLFSVAPVVIVAVRSSAQPWR